jgi:outer membrane protein TolC
MFSPIAALLLVQATLLPLTLDDALHQARERNLDLKMAQARLDQARTMSKKVWSNYLPQIAAGASYTYNNVEAIIRLPTGYAIRQVCPQDGSVPGCFMPNMGGATDPNASPLPGKATDLFMFPTGFSEATIQKHHQLGAQVTINQALIVPTLWPAIEQSYIMTELAELGVETGRRELLFAIAQLYYGSVGAKEAVRVQQEFLAANVAHEKDAEAKVNAGVAPKVVLLRAQIDRTKAEADLKRAQNAYDSTRVALATLLDRNPDFEVVQPAEPPLPVDFSTLEAEAARRPDVAAAEKGYELADKWGTVGTALAYLPTVGLQGAFRAANIGGFAGQATTWFITLGISWTLWDGGLREANAREMAARVVEAEANMKSARLKALEEVRRGILDLKSAQANRTKADETVKLAREGRSLVEVGFKAGTSTYVEVADANAALVGAELGRVAETLNAQLAVLKLAKACGDFNPK